MQKDYWVKFIGTSVFLYVLYKINQEALLGIVAMIDITALLNTEFVNERLNRTQEVLEKKGVAESREFILDKELRDLLKK